MNEEQIRKLLQSSMPPLGEARPARDLWPRMERRMAAAATPEIRFSRWDWVLAAVAAASIVLFPGPILGLLCQF